jgi:sortase A
MAIYCYLKEVKTAKKRAVNFFSYLSLVFGAVLLFWSVYPIFSFEIYSRVFLKNKINNPIFDDKNYNVLGTFDSSSSNNLRDFTQIKLWFPTKYNNNFLLKNYPVKNYSISIPKLNIVSAKVIVGEEDLSKSLIHFLPKSQPGELGNVVILGHSTLPQLYNPKDYKTIFTYLPSLEKGDQIIVNYKNNDYRYEVYEMFVVEPTETWVLDDSNNEPILTLITCVPPGTYWKRLVVRAKLVGLP